ncbi:MAG: hypothetical protein PSV16_11385 [Flavobacterium sp.]|nr:hypothetical protein [Flavobacterium sp.]
MKKIAILFLTLLFTNLFYAQSNINEAKNLIIGNWILSTTTSIYEGKNGISEIAIGTCSYCEKINFKNDFTVEVNTSKDLFQNYKWKIVGDKIYFEPIDIKSKYKFFIEEYLLRFANTESTEVELVSENGKRIITLKKQ